MDRLMRHLIVRRHGDDVLGRVACDLRYAIDDETTLSSTLSLGFGIYGKTAANTANATRFCSIGCNPVENDVSEHFVALTALVTTRRRPRGGA